MNQELFNYHLGTLVSDPSLSSQCKTIREVFLSNTTDVEKLEQIISIITAEEELNDDTLNFLEKGIRVNYGSENTILAIDLLQEADFWLKLQQLFPTNAKLMLIAADANFTSLASDEKIYAPLFIKGMQILGNVYEVGGEIGSVLLETDYRFEYQLVFLEQVLKEQFQYPQDAEDELNELLGEYPFENEKIKAIQELVERYNNLTE